ncbi:MAG TPA: PAS domain-containing sensor histidine kinase [Flavobacteriaceae bacterium]|nr:PAS domain-containing sensor histidine kinase [Flavobacteriaceae bacterium]
MLKKNWFQKKTSSNIINSNNTQYNDESNKWKVALENSKVGLWDWDAKTNEVFYSRESKELLGLDEDEMSNSTTEWDQRVHPDDLEAYFKDFNAHLSGKLEDYKNEHRIQCKDGSYKWILDRGKVIERDHSGKPLRIIGTHTDITQLKKHEAQLKTNLDIITNQNKRLHNFTHIVSHNLRTHIGNLESILEFHDSAETAEEKTEMLNHLKVISKSLSETINDLNNVISIKSRAQDEQINEHVNLADCISKLLESFQLEVNQHNIALHFNKLSNASMFTNKSYLESILHNLISNAIKYRDTKKSAKIDLTLSSSETHINILVSDNGIGIDMEKFGDRVFEMYQTFHGTKRNDSKGIGLYITKSQVEALGGYIEVASTPSQGTKFSISFPKNKAK